MGALINSRFSGSSSITMWCIRVADGPRASLGMSGRCFRAVDAMSDGPSKLIAIDEQPNHQVVHALCLGKTDRPPYQPLDPRAQVAMLALDFLGMCLPNRVLLRLYMPLVGTPPV